MVIEVKMFLLGAVLMLAAACQPVMPEASAASADMANEFQEVTVTYSNDSISFTPAEVPAGHTQLVLENSGDIVLGGPFGRLHEGKSSEDFMEASAGPGGFAALMIMNLVGGIPVAPGATEHVATNLQEGEYLFIASGANGTPLAGTLAVSPSTMGEGSAPEEDVTVTMVDFAYQMPSKIPAGENMWRIRNEGGQIYELLIVPVTPETSLEAAREVIRSIGSPMAVLDGSSPVEVKLLYGPVSPGVETWVPVALDEGTYAMGPLLPDMATTGAGEQPTLLLDRGMVALFTVE